ncbi:uncharacterized protein [Rutidosis leptorrhynchoides]|uniref:uncharacterized protein n=1 Tax=Rutidosis leptorrhynchoides TaxID=125765 RepID=UPI003A9908AA
MASTTTAVLLLLSVIAGVFAISTTARPCKTIFFITSTSSSSLNHHHHHLQNPNSPFLTRNPNNPHRLTIFVSQIHQSHRTRPFPRPTFIDRQIDSSSNDAVSSKPYYDRTMDILSIVGALLFGVGCGALTAATVYLIFSLVSNRRLDFESDSEDEIEYAAAAADAGDDVSAMKNGYVAVPNANKEVPPTADEVDAMK